MENSFRNGLGQHPARRFCMSSSSGVQRRGGLKSCPAPFCSWHCARVAGKKFGGVVEGGRHHNFLFCSSKLVVKPAELCCLLIILILDVSRSFTLLSARFWNSKAGLVCVAIPIIQSQQGETWINYRKHMCKCSRMVSQILHLMLPSLVRESASFDAAISTSGLNMLNVESCACRL